MTELRPYQLDVINQCRQKLAAGVSNICLVAPTGSGKTVIAAEIIRNAVAKGKRVLVLAHTREQARPTSWCSIIPARSTATAASRMRSSGRLSRTSVPPIRFIPAAGCATPTSPGGPA
jgi:ERCC4-related helicase